MRMTLFVKDNKICYSTGSKILAEEKLSPLGWQKAGRISGRDMSGDFPTMTDVLKKAREEDKLLEIQGASAIEQTRSTPTKFSISNIECDFGL